MKRVLTGVFLIAVMVFAAMPAVAFSADPKVDKADATIKKLHELELLNQILPILMTKEQIRKILPEVEKARDKVKKTQELERQELAKLEAKVDSALKDAYDTGKVPTTEVIGEYIATFRKMIGARQLISSANADNVLEKMKETLNDGQLKALENALDPRISDPDLEVSKLTSAQKQLYFVKMILLDPLSYDILLKLSK
ncbi:MAG: hypothetical protein JST40_02590 [Armatimonadetes bacterium]|nr:hypothetical protein [Armatimonadota bacterium]